MSIHGLEIMSKVLSNGTKVVTSKRGANRIIQVFTPNGSLWKTKVKNVAKSTVGDKKVITKKELFYEGEQHFTTDVRQVTTDRVYNLAGEGLGMRRLSMYNTDSCNHELRAIIDNMKKLKDTDITKQFLTPKGDVYKRITIGENGLKKYVTYFPNQYGVGHFVPANEHGIINQQITGLNFLF